MRKIIALAFSVVVFSSLVPTIVSAEAITARRPNAVSFEGLGRAILYSLNYDRSITENIGLGAGLSYFNLSGANVYVFPLYGNYYFFSFFV